MTMPLYASPEQLMRDRSEYARKGIARGRSVVALKYADGVLFVAENPSATLHKVSEIHDRIGFAAAGRYSEYESLRRGGIRHVDLWGYSYDRRDVSARQLANVYAQTLGTIFTEQVKPMEVEICVAEVGATAAQDQLYRLTYDGSIVDEPQFLVMGGQTDPIVASLKENYTDALPLGDAVKLALRAFGAGSTAAPNGAGTEAGPGIEKLEVAVLERHRPLRAFRRVQGAALTALLPAKATAAAETESPAKPVEDVELPPDAGTDA
ncbi:proteasome subunit alpha [Actinokineospora globicatena]|uniref:proteasome subunit alpha n=1 Tax=Actinokineospora globicatena TaxID=103729 RepID=UPI0020A2AA85|nr:proteasome subunit alpha [Actinokineospora globicatena]MCP2306644.1 proteasome alpha subunit [Actinokineospora globicatena]GLW82239.1 proteasome subunit alpha [Actinokineospora globicatena]GLW89032.1 proteasome subunit alpha [Actinokineospora globicatena]